MANDGFAECTLDDLANFRNGKSLSADKYTESGKYPVFGANGQITRTNELLNPVGVIVVGRVGAYCGSIHRIDGPSWVTDNAIVATAQSDVDLRFLYYRLKSLDLRRTAIGSAQPLMTQGGLKIVKTKAPPLREQKAIAHILGTLDDKIELNRRMNETLEGMARAIFKSWFVDFDPVRAKMDGRQPSGMDVDTAALFPESFEHMNDRLIPTGWSIKKVGECTTRHTVGKKYDQKTVSPSGRIPVLDQGKSGIIGYHDDEPGVHASLDEPKAVFANHTCYMRLITFPFSAIQNVLPFTGKGVDTVWVYYSTYGIQPFIEYKGHWPDFIINDIVAPTTELTRLFRKTVQPIISLCKHVERESESLSSLRDTLLPRLLSGELPVNDADAIIEATT